MLLKKINDLLFGIPETLRFYHIIIDILLGFFIPSDGYHNHYRGYKKTQIEISSNRVIKDEEEEQYEK